jgi:hypothetical protein
MTKSLTAIGRKAVCCVCKQTIYKYQEHFYDLDQGYKTRDRWHKKCDEGKVKEK